MKFIALLFLIILFSCGTLGEKKVEKITVAVILPFEGTIKFKEYRNTNEITKTLKYSFIKDVEGNVYANLIRDRFEEAARCQDVISKLLTKLEGVERVINIVERSKLNEIFREIKLQKSGIVDEKTAVNLGRLAAAKYVILIEPRYISLKKDKFIKIEKVDIPFIKEKGKYYCVSLKSSVRVNVSVIEVETGKKVLSKVYEGYSDNYKQCSKTQYREDELPSIEDVIDEAFKNSSRKFGSDFCRSLI